MLGDSESLHVLKVRDNLLQLLAVAAGVFFLELVIATLTRPRLVIIVPTVVTFLVFKPVRVLPIILVLGRLVAVHLLSIAHGILLLRDSRVPLVLLLHIAILLLLLVVTLIFSWPLKPANEYLDALDFVLVLLENLHELTRIHLLLDHDEQLDLLLLLDALVHGILCEPGGSWSGYGRIVYSDRNQLRNLNEIFYLVIGYRLLNLPPSGQLLSLTAFWHRMILFVEDGERLGVKVEDQLLHVAYFF